MTVPTRNSRNSIAKMMGLMVLGLLALADAAVADSVRSSSSSSTSATSTAPAATHSVTVGVDGFTFNPSNMTANVGDIILFQFFPQNHSVARAEYQHPCIPYENTGANKVGFWSGFQPTKQGDTPPTWLLRINDTAPIFFYCSADNACVPNGMIGAINPNATQTFDNQLLFVKNATLQLSPGQQAPAESTPSPTPSSSPSPTSIPAPASGGSSSSLSGGAIAGIAVGAVVVIALAGLTFYLCGRNRTLASVLRYSQPPPRSSGANIPPVPYSPSPNDTPYSPEFKPGLSPSPRPDLSHQSWQTQSTIQALQPNSPEMPGHGGMMSPNSFNPGYGNAGYQPVDNPANIAAYRGHPSPGEAPWAPGAFGHAQYASEPHSHEMATGQEEQLSPGLPSPGSHQERASYMSQPQHPPAHEGPHELDARPAVPETPGAAPPQYASRTFSFSEGGDAPPGVEKILRD